MKRPALAGKYGAEFLVIFLDLLHVEAPPALYLCAFHKRLLVERINIYKYARVCCGVPVDGGFAKYIYIYIYIQINLFGGTNHMKIGPFYVAP